MKPRLPLLLLLALLAPLRAGEIAPVFFREADKDTNDEIEQWVKQLGDATDGNRQKARKELAKIGVWAIPKLADTLEKGAVRQKVNAALALARIDDPDASAVLRAHADAAKEDETRRAVCLALGVFRDPSDLGVLVDLSTNPRNRRGELAEAALALAKVPGTVVAPALAAATAKLTDSDALAAAFVLGSAIADPTAPMAPYLAHKKDLVMRAAAAGLLLRPTGDPAPILEMLRRNRGDRNTRTLLYHALGAFLPNPAAREALLDCAVKDREKTGARVAACIALAREWGVAEHRPALERALRGCKDDLAAPLMYALVRTGTDEAIDALLKQASLTDARRHEPAGLLLIHMLASVRDGNEHPRHDRILQALAENRFGAVADRAQIARAKPWPAYREHAAQLLATVPAPYDLWTHAWEERIWTLVNDLLPEILGLDDIPDWGKHTTTTTPTGEEIDGGRKRTSTKTPWEQDMLSFLREKPYFGPGDLR